jgi:hypothetical protein
MPARLELLLPRCRVRGGGGTPMVAMPCAAAGAGAGYCCCCEEYWGAAGAAPDSGPLAGEAVNTSPVERGRCRYFTWGGATMVAEDAAPTGPAAPTLEEAGGVLAYAERTTVGGAGTGLWYRSPVETAGEPAEVMLSFLACSSSW